MKNHQTIDGEIDIIEETAEGTYRYSDGKYYIMYRKDGLSNMIKVDGNTVTVRRTGDVGSEIKYEIGKEYEFMYKTPYGGIAMSVFTRSITYELDENGGSISLKYILKTGGDKYINKMKIKIER